MPRDLSRIVLLRDLGLASEKGEAEIIRWLRTRPHDECLALIRCVPLDFVQSLTNWVEAAHGPRPLPELIVPKIPEDLPPSLRDGVSRFQARITGRYKQLIAKGHSRSSDYLSRPLFTAIRMARFFAHRGLTQWDALRKRDLVAYLEAYPGGKRGGFPAFIKFLEDNRPFKETRGRPVGNRPGGRKHVVPPSVLPPKQVDEILNQVRAESGDAAFLAAWLVGKMGMTLNAAFKLTLDRFSLNDDGRLAIRPARLWVAIPKSTAETWLRVLEQAIPNWTDLPEEKRSHWAPLPILLCDPETFATKVLKRQSRILRASAIYAAMLKGRLDRVTIHQTMGVSMPTIAKMEVLFSIDLHRKLDPDIVAARNARIRGDTND